MSISFQLMAAGQTGHYGSSVQSHVGMDTPPEIVVVPTLPQQTVVYFVPGIALNTQNAMLLDARVRV